jgi:hypothetical protein
MFKKISLALITALLITGSLSGVAAAQSDTPPAADGDKTGKSRAAIGQITSIGDSSFTLQVKDNEVTILVTDDTVFKNQDGTEASFGDLEIDRWVAGRAARNDDDALVARQVILLPEDFDPANINLIKLGGEVDKINNGQNTFTIITKDGESVTLNVDENTRWKGPLSELKDLEKGMKVGLAAKEQADGSLLAKVIAARSGERELSRAIGKVSSLGDNSLTIDARNGSMTFGVTSDTRFRSQDEDFDSLEDLEIGQGVLVIFNDQETNPTALAIVVGKGEGRKAKRVIGTVQSAGGSHLTIQSKEGEKMSFTVDENTVIKNKDGSVTDLNDLKNGMNALVVYVIQEDGTLLAKIIGARSSDSKPADDNGPNKVS